MGKLKDFEKKIKEVGANNCVYTGVIYCYTNLINGKKYIGQTTDEINRKLHFLNYKEYTKTNSKIDNARMKYGTSDNWKYEVISRKSYLNSEDASFDLDLLEILYITEYNSYLNGYNSTFGGEGVRGYKITEQHRKKLSEIKKGKYNGENNPFFNKHHSVENRRKLSLAHIGKQLSEETKKKISEKLRGKKRTDQTKNKMKLANIGKQLSEEHKQKLSTSHIKNTESVLQIDLHNNQIIKEWRNSNEAAKALNIISSNIIKCCRNKRKTAGGFIWKYAN